MTRISSLAITVCLVLGCSASPSIPVESHTVQGIEKYRGPESGKALLEKNGFVVVPQFYHEIFGPYLNSSLPPFVTADSVHRTFHVIFEDALEQFETAAYEDMRRIVADLRAAVGRPSSLSDGVYALVERYLEVAQCLLEGQDAPAGADAVVAELAKINAAAGIQPSSTLEYELDYSQFMPRGFYTHSQELRRFFKAMTWLGCAAFRLKSDKETAAAMQLADGFRRCPAAREVWRTLDAKYTRLLFPCDDLTVEEYTALLESMAAASAPLPALAEFRAQVDTLRDPRYNDMVLTPDEQSNWIAHSKGMRFMGRRYLPDGGVFDKVAFPNVPNRPFPSGLDVLAANGSAQARRHLEPELAADAEYAAGLEEAAQELAKDKAAYGDSHYVGLLRAMECLTAPPHEKAAPFAKTDAYADKNMMTALAAWASMRHAWILQAKQNTVYLCAEPPQPIAGYIEPNPLFFEAMAALGQASAEIFRAAGEQPAAGVQSYRERRLTSAERFLRFVDFVKTIQGLLERQLHQRRFNDKDRLFFDTYAETLVTLQGHATNVPRDEDFPWMALAADVFTEVLTEQCLEVATGGAMPIYAIVPYESRQYLVLGGVYSYYEFPQPSAQRLTDEDWRGQWDRGQIPALPPWSASFIAGEFDVDKLIEALNRGEFPQEAAFIQDPRLDEFLLAVARGEEMTEAPPRLRERAMTLAVQRHPDEMRRILMKQIREMTPPDFERQRELVEQMQQRGFDLEQHEKEMDAFINARRDLFRLSMMLGPCLNASILAELAELMKTSPNHAAMAAYLSTDSTDKAVEEFWLRILYETQSVHAKQWILAVLRHRGSTDVVPGLLAFVAQAEGDVKAQALGAVSGIIDPPSVEQSPIEHRFMPSNDAGYGESQKAALRQAVIECLDEAIAAGPSDSRLRSSRSFSSIFTMGFSLDVPDMISRIAEGVSAGVWEIRDVLGVLGKIPEEKAVALCGALLPHCDENAFREVVLTLGDLRSERALPYLRKYLNDTSTTHWKGLRVCDHVCLAMERILGITGREERIPFKEGRARKKRIREFDARRAEMLERTKNLVR